MRNGAWTNCTKLYRTDDLSARCSPHLPQGCFVLLAGPGRAKLPCCALRERLSVCGHSPSGACRRQPSTLPFINPKSIQVFFACTSTNPYSVFTRIQDKGLFLPPHATIPYAGHWNYVYFLAASGPKFIENFSAVRNLLPDFYILPTALPDTAFSLTQRAAAGVRRKLLRESAAQHTRSYP